MGSSESSPKPAEPPSQFHSEYGWHCTTSNVSIARNSRPATADEILLE